MKIENFCCAKIPLSRVMNTSYTRKPVLLVRTNDFEVILNPDNETDIDGLMKRLKDWYYAKNITDQ